MIYSRIWAVFRVFSISSTDDELFSVFFVFRRPTTSCFQCFLRFVDRRRVVFCIFRVSSADNGRFSVISAFRSRATNGFRRFLPVACKRNVIFGVFCISLTSDERFFGFLIFPKGWEIQSAAFFGFPKFGKANFQRFPCFPMLG